MIYNEKNITLKNGKSCILRSPTEKDAEEMISYLKRTSAETDHMLRYEDEVTLSLDEEKSFLTCTAEDSRKILIAAFIDGKLAANCGINPVSSLDRCKHRAEFGISIIKDYWDCGLGSAMMSAIIDSAKVIGFELIELDVVSENERAVALYKKFGFKIYGTREKFFKYRNGTYASSHIMALDLLQR